MTWQTGASRRPPCHRPALAQPHLQGALYHRALVRLLGVQAALTMKTDQRAQTVQKLVRALPVQGLASLCIHSHQAFAMRQGRL